MAQRERTFTTSTEQSSDDRVGRIELNGINVIGDDERKGAPSSLFWPWTGASISVLSISYGSWVLGFAVSFWQATIASVLGVVLSGLLCGVVAISGKHAGTPTLTTSRAAFGVRGNAVPSLISWLVSVGWEVMLVTLATLATSTVLGELGWGNGPGIKVAALIVVAVLVVGSGVLGFDTIMRVQTWLTWITGVLTIVYVVLVAPKIDVGTVAALPAGGTVAFLGALIMVFTYTGLGWINAAADYSRYLPRSASSAGVVAWTTIGLSAAPIVLIVFGLLLVGSNPDMSDPISAEPIGALASILPTWFLVPFALVAVLGLAAGAVLDIYSSGLTLLSLGLRVPRHWAAGIDGVIMIVGTVYIAFIAPDFYSQFNAFLVTIGVPLATWGGIFIADIVLRQKPYDEAALFEPQGRYGAVNWPAIVITALGAAVGWGYVLGSADWVSWQGYLFDVLLGGKEGPWAYSNIGVFFAFAIGFVGYLLTGARRVRRQEAR